jgi:predicted dehydrogenase
LQGTDASIIIIANGASALHIKSWIKFSRRETRMINAAMVGLGWWGKVLVQSVQNKSDKIRFTAGAVRTPSKVADFAEEQGLTMHDSLDGVLADDAIDAVVFATPHSRHVDEIVASAAAGKHVWRNR